MERQNIMNAPSTRGTGSWRKNVIGGVALAAVSAVIIFSGTVGASGSPSSRLPHVPVSPEMQAKVGVKIIRATLEGDSGLLDVRYIVLDSPTATYYLHNTIKPPKIVDERNYALITRAAPMADPNAMRPGQTYFLIYQNARNSIHRGDHIDLTVAGITLHGIPVE